MLYSMGCGVLCGVWAAGPYERPAGLVLYASLVGLLSLVWLLWEARQGSRRYYALGWSIGLCAGAISAAWHTHRMVLRQWPAHQQGALRVWTGRVSSLPHAGGFVWETDFGVRVQIRKSRCLPAVRLGEQWRLPVRLYPIRGPYNAVGFRAEAFAWQRRIHAAGKLDCTYFVAFPRSLQKIQAPTKWSLDFWRQWAANRLLQWSVSDRVPRAVSGILRALVVGDQSQIDQAAWQVLQATGTSHLVAISGLHMGLFYAAVFQLCRLSLRAIPIRYWPLEPNRYAGIVAWGIAYGYAQLAGAGIPTQRAMWMLGMHRLAIFCGYRIPVFAAWVHALIGVLLADPFALLSPGFCLSFSAVGAIFWWSEGRKTPVAASAWARQLHASMVSIWVSLALLPFSIGWFQQFPLGGLLANLYAVPWISAAVVPGIFLAVLGGSVYTDLGGILYTGTAWCMQGLWSVLVWQAGYWPVWYVARDSRQMLFAAAAIALWRLPRGMPFRALLYLYAVYAAVPLGNAPAWGTAWIRVLDVGQGLCVAVHTQDHVLVYDTGDKWENRDAGRDILLPYLRQQHVRKVDAVILSHADRDHVGGYAALQSQLPVAQLLVGEPVGGVRFATRCKAGQTWVWDGVRFEMVHPDPEAADAGTLRGNNASCVLRVDAGGHTALLTGDIEHRAEAALRISGRLPAFSHVYTVPHHGSRTSSGTAFLEAMGIQNAIVSAGSHNPYGLPHPGVLARYQERGITMWNTAEHGAVYCVIGESSSGVVCQSLRAKVQRIR